MQFKKNRNEVIRTIQEITKFDEFTINQAIEACQDREGLYSMDQVLNILMDEVSGRERFGPCTAAPFPRGRGMVKHGFSCVYRSIPPSTSTRIRRAPVPSHPPATAPRTTNPPPSTAEPPRPAPKTAPST